MRKRFLPLEAALSHSYLGGRLFGNRPLYVFLAENDHPLVMTNAPGRDQLSAMFTHFGQNKKRTDHEDGVREAAEKLAGYLFKSSDAFADLHEGESLEVSFRVPDLDQPMTFRVMSLAFYENSFFWLAEHISPEVEGMLPRERADYIARQAGSRSGDDLIFIALAANKNEDPEYIINRPLDEIREPHQRYMEALSQLNAGERRRLKSLSIDDEGRPLARLFIAKYLAGGQEFGVVMGRGRDAPSLLPGVIKPNQFYDQSEIAWEDELDDVVPAPEGTALPKAIIEPPAAATSQSSPAGVVVPMHKSMSKAEQLTDSHAPDQKKTKANKAKNSAMILDETRIAAFVDAQGQILSLSSSAKNLEGVDKLVFSDLTAEFASQNGERFMNEREIALEADPGRFRVSVEPSPPAERKGFHSIIALEPLQEEDEAPFAEEEPEAANQVLTEAEAPAEAEPLAEAEAEPAAEAEAPAEAEPHTEAAPPLKEVPTAAEEGGEIASPSPAKLPIRFTFQTNSKGVITKISPELVDEMPEIADQILGQSVLEWASHAGHANLDKDLSGLDARQAWESLSRVFTLNDGQKVQLEFSGLPIRFTKKGFFGFSGFGLCRLVSDQNEDEPAETYDQIEDESLKRSGQKTKAVKKVSSPDEDGEENVFRHLTAREKRNLLAIGEVLRNSEAVWEREETKANDGSQGVEKKQEIDKATKLVLSEIAKYASLKADQEQVDQEEKAPELAARPPAPKRKTIWREMLASPEIASALVQDGQVVDASPALVAMTGHESLSSLLESVREDGLFHDPSEDEAGQLPQIFLPHREGAMIPVRARLRVVEIDQQPASVILLDPVEAKDPAPEYSNELRYLDLASDGYVILDSEDFIDRISAKLAQSLLWRPEDLEGRAVQAILSRESILDWQKGDFSDESGESVRSQRHMVKLADRNGFGLYFQTIENVIEADELPSSRNGKARLIAFHRLSSHALLSGLQTSIYQDLEDELSSTTSLLDEVGGEMSLPISRLVEQAGRLRANIGEQMPEVRSIALDMVRSALHLKQLHNQTSMVQAKARDDQGLNHAPEQLATLIENAVAGLKPVLAEASMIVRVSLQPNLPPVHLEAAQADMLIRQMILHAIHQSREAGSLILSLISKDQMQTIRLRPGQATFQNQSTSLLEDDNENPLGFDKGGIASVTNLTLAKSLSYSMGARFERSEQPGLGYLLEVSFPPKRPEAED